MTGSRLLVLVRHAKAEAFAATDRDRALTLRGRREAAAAGRYLREQGVVPDLAVVSTAVRTRQTWEAMEQAIGSRARAVFDGAVYNGSTDVVLEALRVVPEDQRTVALVGHQPTIGHLAHLLEDGTGDDEALHRMLHGFPTSSMAVFELELAWAELDEETARLVDFRPGHD